MENYLSLGLDTMKTRVFLLLVGKSHLTCLSRTPLLPWRNSSRSSIFNVRMIEVVRSLVLLPRRSKSVGSYREKCQPMWLRPISPRAVRHTVKSLLQPFTTRMSQLSHRRQAEWAAWMSRSPHGSWRGVPSFSSTTFADGSIRLIWKPSLPPKDH